MKQFERIMWLTPKGALKYGWVAGVRMLRAPEGYSEFFALVWGDDGEHYEFDVMSTEWEVQPKNDPCRN